MPKVVDDSQHRQHSLSDWLTLHELDPASCRRTLDAMTREAAGRPATREGSSAAYRAPELEIAWRRTVDAMRAFLPEHRNIIDDTFENTARIAVDRTDKPGKAVTIDNGPAAYPTILFSYRGEPSDFLIVAHEFGHALQLRASQGRFVPPIMREVCAFLSEGALLSETRRNDPARHVYLSRAWRDDNRRYFGAQRDRLRAALPRLDTPYAYSWNYPVARYAASQIAARCSQYRIWSIFEGKTSLRDILREFALSST